MKPIKTALRLFLAACCTLAAVSCRPAAAPRPWAYADLRAFDPLDAPTPATEIVAVYTRSTPLTVEIRLDLLDLEPGDAPLVEISLWDKQRFSRQPLVVTASGGTARAAWGGDGRPTAWPRLLRDDSLDTITVILNRSLIGGRFRFDVLVRTSPGASPADEVRGLRSDGLPPPDRVPLLLAFWDVFPAATPAQALRRWDGAHTGPTGERHGLRHILDASRRYGLPVALLDLKNPASLAALDHIGATAQVRAMAARGLLILPEVAYSRPADVALASSRRAAAGFGLPGSRFVYAPFPDPLPGTRARFISLPEATGIARLGGTKLIPLPPAEPLQATESGPSLEARRSLVAAALSPDPAGLVVLGGSLPASTWGDSDMASPAFAWLAGHPWIRPLTAHDLLSFPAGAIHTLPASPAAQPEPLLAALGLAPDNAAAASAWQAYLTLTAPAEEAHLQALRRIYLGQVGSLLAAARWAEDPGERADCSADLDGDGRPECVLADGHYFAVISPAGARLTHLFHRDAAGPHQLVGPSSQFTVGLSDPSKWRLERGEAADPSVIPGAFADQEDPFGVYEYSQSAGSGEFTFTRRRAGGEVVKIFSLGADGLTVKYRAAGPLETRIPLAVDPQAFYAGPTVYRAAQALHSWAWGLDNGTRIEVRTEAALQAQGFTASLPFLSRPENPNLDFPTGHYFPFPLAVVVLRGEGDFQVQIGIAP